MMENDIASLPLRWLPPGCVSALFMMYLAFCRSAADQERVPASKSTFYTVFQRWKHCLRFRRASDHAVCAECSRLKSKIAACKEALI